MLKHPKTILIIEKDQVSQTSIKDVLEKRHFHVMTSSTSEEALNVIENKHLDLILLNPITVEHVFNPIKKLFQMGWQLPPILLLDEIPAGLLQAFEASELNVIGLANVDDQAEFHFEVNNVIFAEIKSGRRHERATLVVPVKLDYQQRQFEGLSLNVSRSGMFVCCDETVSINEGLAVSFKIQTHQFEQLKCIVKRHSLLDDEHEYAKGFGVEFIDPPQKLLHYLDYFVVEKSFTVAIKKSAMHLLLREGKIEKFNHYKSKGVPYNLSGCDFRGLDLRGIDAADINFSHSYFRNTDLRDVDLSNSDLNGASFHYANLQGTLFPKDISLEEIKMSLNHGIRIRSEFK